jgi:hypothetical protein
MQLYVVPVIVDKFKHNFLEMYGLVGREVTLQSEVLGSKPAVTCSGMGYCIFLEIQAVSIGISKMVVQGLQTCICEDRTQKVREQTGTFQVTCYCPCQVLILKKNINKKCAYISNKTLRTSA